VINFLFICFNNLTYYLRSLQQIVSYRYSACNFLHLFTQEQNRLNKSINPITKNEFKIRV
jgi:hypothetical protein